MLREYSRTKSESLAQIRTIMAEIQHFSRGLCSYWCTLYMVHQHHMVTIAILLENQNCMFVLADLDSCLFVCTRANKAVALTSQMLC